MAILTLAVLLLSATLGGQEVRTHTYTVLYSFQGGEDGAFPVARLLRDKTGIYGTTSYGGGLATCHPLGCGTVFKLKKTGKETLLHKFTGAPDGAYPSGGVLKDAAGNVYGTTSAGGTGVNCYNGSCGIVFKLDKNGKETVLYNFSGGTDGAGPVGDLIQDDAGNFYGATDAGGGSGCGGYGCGTVFKIDTTGAETVLYRFAGGVTDGAEPNGSLILDATSGDLIGSTFLGGGSGCSSYGCGTVFKLDATGTETVLYRFTGGTDGSNPSGGLIWDKAGNLCGTTVRGGAYDYGTVFKLHSNDVETVLYTFTGRFSSANPTGGLVRDRAGTFYGVTTKMSGGTIFEVDAKGKETKLYTFDEGRGAAPEAGLVRDIKGNLYGTASHGPGPGCRTNNDCGVVFELTP